MFEIPSEVVPFLESGVSLSIGTRDAELIPEGMRITGGLRVDPSRTRATVYFAVATGGPTAKNLRDNGFIAVCASEPKTHRTFQLKGKLIELRDARPDELPFIEKYVSEFVDELAVIGLPPQVTSRLMRWPSYAATFEIDGLFVQTPGPKAGMRVEGA
jgi:hypothetical protein